jgi:hypothetical protein
LDAALAYRACGWSPIPLGEDKRPHFAALETACGSRAWSRLQRKTASEDEVRTWYDRYPDARVGIVTGPVSGGLVVVDFDCTIPKGLRVPTTPIVKTRRGLHIYLAARPGVKTTKFPGGELIANGGYVVAPPSCLGGTRREWLIAPEGMGTIFLPEEALADHALLTRQLLPERQMSGPTEQITVRPAIYSCVPRGKEERTEWLKSWDRDADFVRDVCGLVGITAGPIGRAFRCVLPGHTERRPSASLYREPRCGTIRYRDWHTKEWYWVSEVFASVVGGRIGKLNGPSHARWKLRLLLETGRLRRPQISLPPLPARAPASAEAVYQGLRLLLEARALAEPDEPAPFARVFGCAWCGGLAPSTFEYGKGWLIVHGIIRSAGSHRRTGLWLPGSTL